MLRAVIDTNVVLASQRTKHPTSPTAEVVARWGAGHFVWLIEDTILEEYSEKLLEHAIPPEKVQRFITLLRGLAEHVTIRFFHLRHYPVDADDVAFLLAALNGGASHLVTYDEHLESVGIFYPEFQTCAPLEFLKDLRAATNTLPPML